MSGSKWRACALSLAVATCFFAGGVTPAQAAATNVPAAVQDAIRVKATGTVVDVTGTQTISCDRTQARVSVTVTATITGVDDLGDGMDEVTFELWDDGELKDSQVVTIPVGETQAVTVTLGFDGLYQTDASGVGVYVDSRTTIYSNDPFIPTDVGGCEVTPVPTLSGLSLMLLGAGVAGVGVASARRRRRKSSRS